LHDPNYIYCEGVIALAEGIPLPIHHAWVTNKAGEIFEITSGVQHDLYIGVAVTHEFLRNRLAETGYFGLFTGMPDMDFEMVNTPPKLWRHDILDSLPEIDIHDLAERTAIVSEARKACT
jgi:hypothetical protein